MVLEADHLLSEMGNAFNYIKDFDAGEFCKVFFVFLRIYFVYELLKKSFRNTIRLSIGQDKNIFECKSANVFLPISFNICFGCSKEPSH